MDAQLKSIFDRLHQTADFEQVDFSDINAIGIDGDNALHCVVGWGDLAAAKALIDAGIEVNRYGDLGYTPLHVACMKGNVELVRLLLAHGADPYAMCEGDTPFSTARQKGHDHICDVMLESIDRIYKADPKIWVRERIAQLRREIAALEKKL